MCLLLLVPSLHGVSIHCKVSASTANSTAATGAAVRAAISLCLLALLPAPPDVLYKPEVLCISLSIGLHSLAAWKGGISQQVCRPWELSKLVELVWH